MFRTRFGRFILASTIVLAAAFSYVFFGLHILLGLVAVNVIATMVAPLVRKRGWGHEGRLTRWLNRPRFDDPSRRSVLK
jgi:hypothetical protein